MGYRVYYPDGKTSEEDKPPARGVQVIVQDNPFVGVELVTGKDYFVREIDENGNEWWRGVDIFGLYDYLIESGLVLFGRTLTQKEYNAIMTEANKDKTGWLPRERKASE